MNGGWVPGNVPGNTGRIQIGSRTQPGQKTPPAPPPKPMGLIKTITRGSIKLIDDMSGNGASPVFLVVLQDDTELVVKQEKQFTDGTGRNMQAFAKANLSAINNVMRSASATATIQELTKDEIAAIETFPARPLALGKAIKECKPGWRTMMKMNRDLNFYAGSAKSVAAANPNLRYDMNDKDVEKAKHMFTLLRNNGPAWKSLGEISIVDAFIGNLDRICVSDWTVTNYGNLIFSYDAATKRITHALGLDAIDPSAMGRNMMFGTNINEWADEFGQHIKNKHSFGEASRSVFNKINQERMLPLGLTPYRPDREGKSFAEGLVSGWDKQAASIGSAIRSGQRGVPSGVASRAVYLGWA